MTIDTSTDEIREDAGREKKQAEWPLLVEAPLIGGKTSISPVTTPDSSTVWKEPVETRPLLHAARSGSLLGKGCSLVRGRAMMVCASSVNRSSEPISLAPPRVGGSDVRLFRLHPRLAVPAVQPSSRPALQSVLSSSAVVRTLDFGPATRTLPSLPMPTTHRPQTGQRLTDMAIMHDHATLGPPVKTWTASRPWRAREPL
ncbi:hypothetical protein B0T18DRAFT_484199 [Schizothecium vesticola]|uniref:Uncharacterized protein n=1 Tax=Schizothecium vesticola TaxID=314040 RepID=A0AA40KBT3_9PEZI|nr:hypothetical protein B0T18DRAFT_484199 [Schizothecium vesticola]